MRPAISSENTGANAQISEPSRKVACVSSSIFLVSSHWIRLAVMGMNAPRTSKKPVTSHCTVVLSTPKSFMMVVSATLSSVSFK